MLQRNPMMAASERGRWSVAESTPSQRASARPRSDCQNPSQQGKVTHRRFDAHNS
jgi:hypothetical protein